MNSMGATNNGILNGNLSMSYSQSFLNLMDMGSLLGTILGTILKKQTPMSIIKASFIRLEMTAAHMAPGSNNS